MWSVLGQRRLWIVGMVAYLLGAGCSIVLTGDPTPSPPPSPSPAVAQTVPTASPSPTPTAPSSPTPSPTPTVLASLPVTFETRPLAVMIDNSPSARPHSGLASADLVYEAVVEAGITRLMAVFGKGDSTTLGPVRSTRHYFVYWAYEHNAVLVHAGASPQGFVALDNVGLDTLDNSYGTGFFWRVDRPHSESWENLYTNTVKDRPLLPSGGGHLGALQFKPAAGSPGAVSAIGIPYPNGYLVEYRYDKESNTYLRHINGRPHADEQSGVQYRGSNIVVQWMETWPIAGDDKGRMDMKLVGEGQAQYFLDGSSFEGRWRKESLQKPTEFLDKSGALMRFNHGQTWINVVPDGTALSVR